MNDRYVLGIDYGTLSGRTVLVNCNNGKVVETAVKKYTHGVLDLYLPDGETKLGINWALEYPQDYLEVLQETIPRVIRNSGILSKDIIGLSIDFTASTVLPIDSNGCPLCMKEEYKNRPHAYVKLWKHHAAQNETDHINKVLEEIGELQLPRYGGKISPELLLPKIMQIVNEDYEIYEKMDQFLEAGDWLTLLLTGKKTRSENMAAYKAMWMEKDGYPSHKILRSIDERIEYLVEDKLSTDICPAGGKIGELTYEWAEKLGLIPGIAIGASIIDSHAGMPGSGISKPGQMMLVLGTSSVLLLLSEKPYVGSGVAGAVKGAIIPEYYSLESGLAAVGDMFGWFIENYIPIAYEQEAKKTHCSVYQLLTNRAEKLRPGESGLIALDWWNGNKTPYVSSDLSGVIIGLTLGTKPEEIYRALIEATAFGTALIIEEFEKSGVSVEEIIASGGITEKNSMLMQIYADVTNKTIRISATNQTAALGAAMYASVAAGVDKGGFDSLEHAAQRMGKLKTKVYKPIEKNNRVYREIYQQYKILVKQFAPSCNQVMKSLKKIKCENSFHSFNQH